MKTTYLDNDIILLENYKKEGMITPYQNRKLNEYKKIKEFINRAMKNVDEETLVDDLHITLIQKWEEDEHDKTGWSTWGWEDEKGNLFDKAGYEIEKVLEEDKYGHITKAVFKYVGIT